MLFQIGDETLSCCSALVGDGNVAPIGADGREYRCCGRRIERHMVGYTGLADAAPVTPGHIGIDTAFVQKYQMFCVNGIQ